MTIRFDTKIAIAVRADLEPWQKLNVTAFLASGIAASSATPSTRFSRALRCIHESSVVQEHRESG